MIHCGSGIEGSLPSQITKLHWLHTLLVGNLKLSGTVPDGPRLASGNRRDGYTSEDDVSSPWQMISGKCNVDSLGCVESYAGDCKFESTLTGYVSAFPYWVGATDVLEIGGVAYNYTAIIVSPGTVVQWKYRSRIIIQWRLCYSPVPWLGFLETLSFGRNFLQGGTSALQGARNLGSLVLSGNYFSCDADELNGARNLGETKFKDPVADALAEMGWLLALHNSDKINPYSFLDARYFDGIVLSFAGNPSLTSRASGIPDNPAGILLQRDEVKNGQVTLFTGDSDFKQLLFVTVPGLLLAHGTVVGVLLYALKVPVSRYLKRVPVRQESMLSEVTSTFLLRWQWVLVVGFLFLGLNLWNFSFNGSGCGNVFIYGTLTGAHYYTDEFPWVWLCTVIFALSVFSRSIGRLIRRRFSDRARSVYGCFLMIVYSGVPIKAVIDTWRENARKKEPFLKGLKRRMLFWMLHIPFAFVVSLPVILFNVPAKSIGHAWLLQILGNSGFLAVFQILVSGYVIPQVAKLLSKLKFWNVPQDTPEAVIEMNKTQVATTLLLEVATTFLMDSSCLRYYLLFDDNLRRLLETWGIGKIGIDAYRTHFCTLWVTASLVTTLIGPLKDLALAHPWLQARLARQPEDLDDLSSTEDCAKETQGQLVAVLTLMLTILLFTPVVPLLLVILPLALWVLLCAFDFTTHYRHDLTFGEVMAANVLVQLPTGTFQLMFRVGYVCVVTVMIIDLGFHSNVLLIFFIAWCAEIIVQSWLSTNRHEAMEREVRHYREMKQRGYVGIQFHPSPIKYDQCIEMQELTPPAPTDSPTSVALKVDDSPVSPSVRELTPEEFQQWQDAMISYDLMYGMGDGTSCLDAEPVLMPCHEALELEHKQGADNLPEASPSPTSMSKEEARELLESLRQRRDLKEISQAEYKQEKARLKLLVRQGRSSNGLEPLSKEEALVSLQTARLRRDNREISAAEYKREKAELQERVRCSDEGLQSARVKSFMMEASIPNLETLPQKSANKEEEEEEGTHHTQAQQMAHALDNQFESNLPPRIESWLEGGELAELEWGADRLPEIPGLPVYYEPQEGVAEDEKEKTPDRPRRISFSDWTEDEKEKTPDRTRRVSFSDWTDEDKEKTPDGSRRNSFGDLPMVETSDGSPQVGLSDLTEQGKEEGSPDRSRRVSWSDSAEDQELQQEEEEKEEGVCAEEHVLWL